MIPPAVNCSGNSQQLCKILQQQPIPPTPIVLFLQTKHLYCSYLPLSCKLSVQLPRSVTATPWILVFFPYYSILILQQHCFSNLSSGAVQESINFKTWDLQRTLSGTHYNMYPGDLELFKDSYSCSGVGKCIFLTSTKLRILFVFTLKRYYSLQPAFKTSH